MTAFPPRVCGFLFARTDMLLKLSKFFLWLSNKTLDAHLWWTGEVAPPVRDLPWPDVSRQPFRPPFDGARN